MKNVIAFKDEQTADFYNLCINKGQHGTTLECHTILEATNRTFLTIYSKTNNNIGGKLINKLTESIKQSNSQDKLPINLTIS